MKNSKFKVVMYVNLVLIALALISNVCGYVLTKDYQFILNGVAITYSLVYLLYGYKKEAALYFKWFMILLAIKEVVALVHMVVDEKVPFYASALIIAMILSFILLAFVKDLGKKKSYILCSVIIALSTLTFVAGLFFTPAVITEATREGTLLAIFNLTRVLMSIILIIMVYAKYEDKYSRGTK